tara:strand:+ start:257 stop:541 length:285 start_codon:yes stop_codon:yes gene_type:complete
MNNIIKSANSFDVLKNYLSQKSKMYNYEGFVEEYFNRIVLPTNQEKNEKDYNVCAFNSVFSTSAFGSNMGELGRQRASGKARRNDGDVEHFYGN